MAQNDIKAAVDATRAAFATTESTVVADAEVWWKSNKVIALAALGVGLVVGFIAGHLG